MRANKAPNNRTLQCSHCTASRQLATEEPKGERKRTQQPERGARKHIVATIIITKTCGLKLAILDLHNHGEKRRGGRTVRPARVITGGTGARDGAEDDVGDGVGDGVGDDAGDDESRAAGGRAHCLLGDGRGCCGADISWVKKGFNLSTETVQGFPARDNTNVFSPGCSTS